MFRHNVVGKLWIIFFDYNIYQTWAYQQIRAETDATKLSRFIVVGDDNIPFIMGQIRIKSLINFKIGYIQLGPIFQRREMMLEELPEAIKILIQNLIEKLGLDIIRINLNLWKGQNDFAELFKRVGFTEAKYYRTYKTFVVSLERSEQEIFKDIDSENRRLIRKAEKLGLEFGISYNEEYQPYWIKCNLKQNIERDLLILILMVSKNTNKTLLKESLSSEFENILLDESSHTYEFLKPNEVQSLYKAHTDGKADNHKILFSLIVLEKWMRENCV